VLNKGGPKDVGDRLIVLIGAAVALTLGGCVLPKRLPEQNPFRSEIIGFIEPGSTTGDEIEEILGTPLYRFSGGRWWAYCAHRRETEWVWFMLAQNDVVGGTFGGDTEQQSLVLRFGEENVVDEVTVINAEDGCTRDGTLCHDCGILEILQDGKKSKLIGSLGNT
jgi:outer membrane protein assembly factor BamE (lipoprotein component of BamABCDE complex)